MDDQDNRASGGLRSILWWLGIIALLLTGLYGAMLACLGFQSAAKNYDPLMAKFFEGAIFGGVCGVAFGAAGLQTIRRYKIRFTRFSVRDLLIVTTLAAIGLGLLCYVLNKK